MMRHFVTELLAQTSPLVLVQRDHCIYRQHYVFTPVRRARYKPEKSIQRIANGDLTFEIHLRRNDSLKELAVAINSMLSRFRETLAQARTLSDDVASKLGTLGKDEKFRRWRRTPRNSRR